MPKFTRNDDGTVTQDVGGYKALVIDPDGSYEREMSDPADVAAFNAQAPHVAAATAPYQPQLSPEQKAALAQPSGAGPTATIVEKPSNTGPRAVVEPLAPQAQVEAPQMVSLPGSGPESKTTTTNQSGGSTQGYSDADRKAIEGAGKKVSEGQRDVANETAKASAQVAAQRESQAKQDYMSGYVKEVGALEAQDRYKKDLSEAVAERKAARSQKMDPVKAFGSERTSWAIMAGLEGALAALDTGIARLQKRGTPPPSTLISDMVDRSIAMQKDEREQRLAAAGESVDMAQEGLLEQKSNAHEAAAQLLEARKLVASSAEQVAFLDAEAAKQRVAADNTDLEIAKTVATKKASSWQKDSNTVATSGGPGGNMLVVPGSERAAEDQKLIQDTLSQAYPSLKPEKAQAQWDEFQKQYLGTSGMNTAVKNAQEAIKAAAKDGDVSGFGWLAKRLPTSFASFDAVQKRQAIGQAMALYIKSLSGAAATDKEVERLTDNVVGAGDYETMKNGLDQLSAQAEATDREMQKTKPQLYKLADYLGKRQSNERGADKAVEKF